MKLIQFIFLSVSITILLSCSKETETSESEVFQPQYSVSQSSNIYSLFGDVGNISEASEEYKLNEAQYPDMASDERYNLFLLEEFGTGNTSEIYEELEYIEGGGVDQLEFKRKWNRDKTGSYTVITCFEEGTDCAETMSTGGHCILVKYEPQ